MTKKQIEKLGFEFDGEAPSCYYIRRGLGIFFSITPKQVKEFSGVIEVLEYMVDITRKKAFEDGRQSKITEIKNVLNI